MRSLVLTPKFKRAFRKFVKRNADIQQRIEQDTETNSEVIVLLDIGTHDEVY
jgi:mRNA-degrading endonuclease YafQ of YafQ-DinJ toxin-antitoxin module